jgi:DNA-binding transcriptional ArsR family regulator
MSDDQVSVIVPDSMPEKAEVPGSVVPLSEVKAELFKALAHPARIRALEVLSERERSVSELQPLVGIESSHLSQQLGVLRRAGLVSTRKEGSSVIYALRDPLVAELLLVAKRFLLSSLTETSDLLANLRSAVSAR